MAQPQLAPGMQLGRDRAIGQRQLVDLAVLEHGAEQREQARAADEAAAPGEVHQPHHGAPREAADPALEHVKLAGGVDGAHQRADRRAADEVGLDTALLERADRADVRPAARAAGAQGEGDFGSSMCGHNAGVLCLQYISPFSGRVNLPAGKRRDL